VLTLQGTVCAAAKQILRWLLSFVQVDAIKNTLENDERKVGAEIVRRSLGYPLKLIANNAGVNGSVVQQKVLESSDPNVGYNASTGEQLPGAVPSVQHSNPSFLVLICAISSTTVLFCNTACDAACPTCRCCPIVQRHMCIV